MPHSFYAIADVLLDEKLAGSISPTSSTASTA